MVTNLDGLAGRRLVAVLLLLIIMLGALGAPPAAAAEPYRFTVDPASAFLPAAQKKHLYGSATQAIRNLVNGTSDRTRAAQRSYATDQRSRLTGTSVSAHLKAWKGTLGRFAPSGRYRVVRRASATRALHAAAIRIRSTGRPVGLVVASGRKPMVMTGFQASADPTEGAATITSIVVLDPGYPKWSVSATGTSAVRVLTVKQAAALLAPKGGSVRALLPKRIREVALGLSQHPENGLSTLDAVTSRLGRVPAIWSLWSSWGDRTSPFPSTQLLDGIVERGSVPMLFWNPVGPDHDDPEFGYARIAAGDHDAYIRSWAEAAKAWGKPIIVRWAQEMNGTWFPWSIGKWGNTPANFKAAWRHLWRVIRDDVGAVNVRFAWTPYTNAGCGPTCPTYASLWPGDAFVDYAGFSVFDWGGNVTAVAAFRPPVNAIMKITSKPIIVAETGTPAGTRKRSWIRGFEQVYAQLPRIVAIVYFDVRVPGQPDWRLTQPVGAEAVFGDLLAQPRFQGLVK